ncbi:MAG TPA: hypothetical protein V6D03_13855, partial [Candidatus Caenarcaniphilales bacterium]
VAIAHSYPEVDRVQAPQHFFPFLLWGKTAANWQWHRHGVVLFLGGDQFFTVVIGKRLGYRTVVYGEREVRWLRWIDRFGVMKPELSAYLPQRYASKLTVVGDLMAEAGVHRSNSLPGLNPRLQRQPGEELIALLPGSKPAKLAQALPLMLASAEHIHRVRPQVRFVIPIAPTLDLATLSAFADPSHNPVLRRVNGATAQLLSVDQEHFCLQTEGGLQIELWTDFPAYDLLRTCCLSLTTVGANTAELGSLAIPMLVILPTQQLDAMRAWDGLPGLLANLPGIGAGLATIINWLALQRLGLLAWPNIWAGKEIVPELVGQLQPQVIAEKALDFLNHPEKLDRMRCDLRNVRGKPGAADKLARLVSAELALQINV